LNGGWLSLKSERPRQAPYTNGLVVAKLYNGIIWLWRRGADAPLISMRPFAVAKWSAWLVSKKSPVPQTPNPVILKSATISYRNPCQPPHQIAQKKTLGLQKPSLPNIMGRRNKRAGMPAYDQVGSATGGQ
jgi:hypothetical protein